MAERPVINLSEKQLRSIIDGISAGIGVFDSDEGLLYANHALLQALNLSFSDIEGDSWQQYLYSELSSEGNLQGLNIEFFESDIQNRYIEVKQADGEPLLFLVSSRKVAVDGQTLTVMTFHEHGSIQWREKEAVRFQTHFASELKLARKIQDQINNNIIEMIEGRFFKYHFYSSFLPSSYLSADIMNVNTVTRRYSSIFLGDGRGHGIPAALYSGLIYSYLNAVATDIAAGNDEITSVVANLNRSAFDDFSKNTDYYFFSGVFALIDGNTDLLHLTNGGHPPVILLRPDNTVESIQIKGPIFGIDRNGRFDSRTLHLEGGETLVFYTDGLSEIENDNGDIYTDRRVFEYFEQNAQKLRPEEIHSEMLQQALEFAGGREIRDDISILVLHVEKKS